MEEEVDIGDLYGETVELGKMSLEYLKGWWVREYRKGSSKWRFHKGMSIHCRLHDLR